MCCVLSGPFATAGSHAYTHAILVVIVGSYTFQSRIHKVAIELPNIIEGLVGVCCFYLKNFFVSTSNLSNRWYRIQLLASSIALLCDGTCTMMRFVFQFAVFQFAVLHLQLQSFSASTTVLCYHPYLVSMVFADLLFAVPIMVQ